MGNDLKNSILIEHKALLRWLMLFVNCQHYCVLEISRKYVETEDWVTASDGKWF